ncbi:hypothetical protein GCM10010297_18450 [Streptomyces malachitofuscus]|nr:hypothetical protein GCM10010297_18450 [Streptomyces malachitofuscus]
MSRAGAACTDMDRPVAAADPVICRTSRFCTVSCIQVPALDTKFATDHQRMLRCRRERQGERDSGWAGVSEEDTVRYSETSRRARRREAREAERRLRCTAAPVTGTGRGPSWQKGTPSRFREAGGSPGCACQMCGGRGELGG